MRNLPNGIAAVLILLLPVTSIAQILYTDIPDTVLSFPGQVTGFLDDSTHYVYIDLNADDSEDYYFLAHYWEEWKSPSAPENPNYVIQVYPVNDADMVAMDPQPPCLAVLDYGMPISGSLQWANLGDIYVNVFMAYYNCRSPYQDKYFGIKFCLNGNLHYGWIRVDFNGSQLIIKDFAINLTPGGEILAGAMDSSGLPDSGIQPSIRMVRLQEGVRIYSCNDPLKMALIYGMNGALLYRYVLSGHESTISPGNFVPGMYLFRIITDREVVSFKYLWVRP